MKGYLVDIENDKAKTVEIQDNDHLGQFYKLIGCDCIDITVRKVGGKPYNVVLDDEGLLVADPKFSAIDGRMHAMLAGNIILFGIGEDYDLTDIDEKDVENITENMYEVFDFDTMTTHPVVVMEY